MKRPLLILLVLLFGSAGSFAQRTKDVIYLKNGSIIYGKLLEISGEKYKMQTSDGSIFMFDSEEVDKFTKESPLYNGRKPGGFSFALEAGLLAGAQNTDFDAPFSFNILAGAIINTRHVVGGGTGVEFIGRPYVPFIAEYKFLTSTKKTSPYFFTRAGVLTQIGGEDTPPGSYYNEYQPYNYKGGATFAIGSGISWSKDDYETYLSFAYRYAHTSYQQKEYNRGVITYENNLNRLELKFGFRF
jgi:hypothetical protein